MAFVRTCLCFVTFAVALHAKPLDIEVQRRDDPTGTLIPCASCNRGSWTPEPSCTNGGAAWLTSVMSRITNPPAPTPTSVGLEFCSNYLQPVDESIIYEYSTGVSTLTSRTDIFNVITITDFDHPTATMLCPSPSQKAECGWDSNVISDTMQEIHGIEINQDPETCQQSCLNLETCKSFRVAPLAPGDSVWNCELFGVPLGDNASNLVSSSKGSQWFDRNCADHAPGPCKPSQTAVAARDPAIANPMITAAPAPLLARDDLAKRGLGASVPAYLTDIRGIEQVFYFPYACSCLITSASPVVTETTTSTVTRWSGTTTTTTTFVDNFTTTVTARSTTTYVSVN